MEAVGPIVTLETVVTALEPVVPNLADKLVRVVAAKKPVAAVSAFETVIAILAYSGLSSFEPIEGRGEAEDAHEIFSLAQSRSTLLRLA